MLDPKLLRNDIESVAKQLQRRGFELDVERFKKLNASRHALQEKTQELQNIRNKSAKAIGQAKAKGEDVDALLAEVKDVGDELDKHQSEFEAVKAELEDFQLHLPNILDESVPQGKDEESNVFVHDWGEKPSFDFKPLDHIELGAKLGMIDFEAASKMSGSRFVVLHREIAQLQRALAQFMIDVQVREHGYQEVYVPYLVHKKALYGSGQLPKFKEDLFEIAGDWDFMLIPTAEVALVNLVREQIIDAKALPLKFAAQTPCFRSEAGSYGKDTRGMIRQHQFQKIELVQITKPEDSARAHDEILKHAETILQRLELPYRNMLLCSGDTGFGAAKTYDLEVWMPGQDCYREISSVSNCEDFQARRIKARWRDPNKDKPQLVHTLNGSGLAVGRALIAVIENYQQPDGSIKIPKVLQSYMGGIDIIKSK